MATKNMSLKLLVDTKGKKVLFAEAGKDFVDFLFDLLRFPVGTVGKQLKGKGKVGCFGNLYESFKNFDESYMQPNVHKDTILNPEGKSAKPSSEGYVRKLVTYMIFDNLTVTPLSMVSSIKMINKCFDSMINKCHDSKLEVLEVRKVEVRMDKALEWLKTSFETETALTTFFLK